MKHWILSGCLIWIMSSLSVANVGLITSLTTSSHTSGGLRFAISSNEVIDVGLTHHKTQNPDEEWAFWADYYKGLFGVLVHGYAHKNPQLGIAGMVAFESPISKTASLGIGYRVIDIQPNQAPQYGTSWDSYLVIMLK